MMIPIEFETVRLAALRALGPIKPADNQTQAEKDFLFRARESVASKTLPPNYLLYFLLVDFLGFQDLGHFEKIAWSIPIDFKGRAFLIEYRKFGVGIFVQDLAKDEAVANEIAIRLQKAVKASTKFFDWLADQAVAASKVNVNNESRSLFDRYLFFRDSYEQKLQEPIAQKKLLEQNPEAHSFSDRLSNEMKILGYHREAVWFAEASVDAFFYWTEHVLIHLAILTGKVSSALQVAELAESDWPDKFKATFSIVDPKTKSLFDRLLVIRRDLRNYTAHGSFGKNGEAFKFHSNAGAAPVLLPHRAGSNKFKLGRGNALDYEQAFAVIDEFVDFIWRDERKPAELYIQGTGLPCILTMCNDGSYQNAMTSIEAMTGIVEHLSYLADQAANMDW